MTKKMNLDQFQKETEIAVVKRTLTIIDRRTGAVENRVFFRFGFTFPINGIAKELDNYGYDVLGYGEEEVTEGVLDYEMLFASLAASAEVA